MVKESVKKSKEEGSQKERRRRKRRKGVGKCDEVQPEKESGRD